MLGIGRRSLGKWMPQSQSGRSAIERTESRGAHFRDDRPAKDAALGKVNIVVRRGPDGAMQVARRAIPPMRPDLQQIVEEMK